jgi:LacI family repressor for deo operon, udp, cdd, tsx, nupC, and nupG
MSTKRDSATMRDVAEHAGVSVQTVSYVVNQTGSISDETRDRVQRSIEALNYRRNPIARSMRTRKTRMIALIILDITNPVLSLIASTIESEAYAQDYHVLLYNTAHNPARELAYLNEIGSRRADGVIIVNTINRENMERLTAEGVPTVLVDSPILSSPVPVVSVDNSAGAYAATRHLIDLGHRRIAHIAGSRDLGIARERALAYTQALNDSRLSYQRIVYADSIQWGYESGYSAMHQLLAEDNPPTAVFAASDALAIGAYRALAELGLRVPDDMSVVGFDNIEASAFTTPPLTTVHQPFSELGSEAFSLLLSMLDGNQRRLANVLLPAEIVFRGSTEVPRERISWD